MNQNTQKSKETRTKTITLQQSIVDKVEEIAKNENRNFSNMVETILLKYVPNEPNGYQPMT